MEVKWSERVTSAAEKYPDFAEKVTKGADNNAWACPPVVALGIKASEYGPDVAYHLATNVEESRRIASMHPLEQAREFGRLEARFELAAKQTEQPKPKTVTQAAPPPSVQARGAGGKFAVSADTEDFAAFDKAYGNARR
jgi:hypothetical protein